MGSSKIIEFCFLGGYQTFLILAVFGYINGILQGKEYAEAEWYADLLLTAVWLCYFCSLFDDSQKQKSIPYLCR